MTLKELYGQPVCKECNIECGLKKQPAAYSDLQGTGWFCNTCWNAQLLSKTKYGEV